MPNPFGLLFLQFSPPFCHFPASKQPYMRYFQQILVDKALFGDIIVLVVIDTFIPMLQMPATGFPAHCQRS